jgi:hypothetical protein
VPLEVCRGVLALKVPWEAVERMCSTLMGEDMGVEVQEGCLMDCLLPFLQTLTYVPSWVLQVLTKHVNEWEC